MKIFGTLNKSIDESIINCALKHPSYIHTNGDYLVVSDTGNNQVIIIDKKEKISKNINFDKNEIIVSCAIMCSNKLYCINKINQSIFEINSKKTLIATRYTELWGLSLTYSNTMLFTAPKEGAIVEINKSGDIIFEYSNTKLLKEPRSVVKIREQEYYILDASQHCVFLLKKGKLSLIFGEIGVPGQDLYHLKKPWGFDLFENTFYICDSRNSRILELEPPYKKAKVIDINETIIQNDIIYSNYKINRPMSIKVTESTMYIVDSINQNILEWSCGKIKNICGCKNEIYSILKEPRSIDIYENNMLVVDSANDRLIEFDLETAKVKSIILCDDFSWVRCAKYIDFNHILIVQASVNSNKHKIYMLDKTTRRSIPIMKKINALLDDPHSISFDTYNNIIISDANLNYVIIYNILDQTHITIGTEHLKNPHFAISYNEKIYICDTDNDRIAIFNNRNELDGHISLNLKNPRSIDINESKFIIADSSNSNIVLYDNQCLYTYSKSLKRPQYVLFNKGKLYVSDFCKNIVIELTKEEMTCEKHNIY